MSGKARRALTDVKKIKSSKMGKQYFIIKKFMLVFSVLFGLIGAIIIVGNELPLVTKIQDKTKKWMNVKNAVNTLDSLKYINPERSDVKSGFVERYGYLENKNVGFKELLRIIQYNMPELKDSNIVEIDKSAPIVLGGIGAHVINLRYTKDQFKKKFEYHPITTEYEFNRWIREYKHKCLLDYGIIFLVFSYFLNLGALMLKQPKNMKNIQTKIKRKTILRKHLI